MRRSALFLLASLALPAWAHDYHQGQLHIDHPWARAMPANAVNGAAYLTVHNHSEAADQLIAASTSHAEKVELHTHVHEGELMRMQQVESIEVPAGGQALLAPGGHHLMLMGLKQPLNAGDSFNLTLEFAEAGPVEVQVQVQALSPNTPHSSHQHH